LWLIFSSTARLAVEGSSRYRAPLGSMCAGPDFRNRKER
jgi:hypothetical protein